MTPARLHDLPSEIYLAILSFVPSSDLQHTVLSLSRVLPYSPIPIELLYRSIRLKRPLQVIQLYHRLRSSAKAVASHSNTKSIVHWIREFSLECWTADAEVVINILGLIPQLESLSIWIGANNFTPEHLEELFMEPIDGLGYLSLRFKPYVQQANYYQFLKGAYFDSTLRALARWPAGSIPVLSLTQDAPDPKFTTKKTFAQPIVFFQLDPYLSAMLHSPALTHTASSLRLRIPSRPVARSLCFPPPPHAVENVSEVRYIAPLKYLDLSTCGVIETELDTIMIRFKGLKHLVLDKCTVLRGEMREGEWSALGKRCAMIGATRAREREKKLKAFLESQAASLQMHVQVAEGAEQQARPARTRRGRRGLATATISLRDRPEEPAPRPSVVNLPRSAVPKIRILPPLPSLMTLCMTPSAIIQPDRYTTLRAEFETGWAEGIGLLRVGRARLRTSASNGIRVVRFVDDNHEITDQGLDGLEDIDIEDEDAFDVPVGEDAVGGIPPPVLCFVGGARTAEHAIGCGHSIGWDIWKDDLELD
ncbi:hypothetical protein BDQ17DRAFT_1387587 [Cyathus striatus]|nr:hypothetical protein BDQ17DRAFT_1387587 [Cyathus striatus]